MTNLTQSADYEKHIYQSVYEILTSDKGFPDELTESDKKYMISNMIEKMNEFDEYEKSADLKKLLDEMGE